MWLAVWDVSKQIKVDKGESDGKKYALVFGVCLTSIENPYLVWEFGKNCLWKKNKGVSTIDESKTYQRIQNRVYYTPRPGKKCCDRIPALSSHYIYVFFVSNNYTTTIHAHTISYNCIYTHTFSDVKDFPLRTEYWTRWGMRLQDTDRLKKKTTAFRYGDSQETAAFQWKMYENGTLLCWRMSS